MEKRLIIIDGNSLINRAFYAVPPLTDKNGMHTNAIYGFANILFKIISDYSPTHIGVAFDLKAPTFRHKMYADYKGTRKGMPEELAEQLAPLKEMLDYFNITKMELAGYEADDIIGTVSKYFESQDIETLIITGDRDSFQLASDKIKILFTKKGVSELEIVDKQVMMNTYGITPTQFIDLKALMGDTSDNIKGVAGIGEKTGLKLIKEYKSIENLYDHIDEIKGSTKTKLENDKESAYLSKQLATININIPVDIETDEFLLKDFDNEKLNEFFIKHNMMSLVKKLKNFSTEDEQSSDIESENISKVEKIIDYSTDVDEFLQDNHTKIAIKIVRENSLVDIPAILSICVLSNGKFYSISDFEKISHILEDENIQKIGYDIKNEYLSLLPYDISLNGITYDLKIAKYLLSPDNNSYDISDISMEYGLSPLQSHEEFFGKGKKEKVINPFTKKEVEEYYMQVLDIVDSSHDIVIKAIKDSDMTKLFEEVEIPLITVLSDMEYIGVAIDKKELENQKIDFANHIQRLESEIYELAGEKFNINSPKQLGVILFEKLNLPPVKKTKTGYSTDASVLEELSDKHDIIEKIISYRQYTKLQSTYVEGLLNIINPNTARIHSSFNQTIAATGRISSTEPNLQNIPVRLEIGRNLRKAFIAKQGCVLVDSDYSQIELRVLAHISDEEALIQAFSKDADIHTQTASEVFAVDIADVTKEQRSAAKAVNFGIVYGISDFGLSNNLGITKKKAGQYIKTYLDRYKNIEKYMQDIIRFGEEHGYVTTILGRRRNIPQLKQKNIMIKNLGKRLAMNTPIQGSAADIIKIAMVRVSNRLKKENLKSKLILQVHDELIIEATEDEKDYIKELLRQEMSNAYDIKVELKVDINVGNSWFDTK